MVEIKEAGEEAARWREACELEVEAGRAVILEREKEVRIWMGCFSLLFTSSIYSLLPPELTQIALQ